MADLPSSQPEKDEHYQNNHIIERWLFVHELRALLDQLEPTDWLVPNAVGNLSVRREGFDRGIGAIDFHFNEIEWFIKDSTDDSDE